MSTTYKDAGVDIQAGEELVDAIKPLVKSTHNKNVLSNIGLFGGFYEADFSEYKRPVLVSSVDGVGTKLKVAYATGKHDTVGQCLVNHCTDDILCCGAKPLFFLDYFATGKLEQSVGVEVIKGFATACRENDCALIGGETAEMPSIYKDGEYDLGGTIVGIVDKDKVIDGSKIEAGDVMIGLRSSGLHTNGYSLARHVLFQKHNPNDYIEEFDKTLGEELLSVHISYLNEVHPMAEEGLLNGISHITGGGIVGNTSRIMPKDLEMKIDWNSWDVLPIFDMIRREGNVAEVEMRKAFNLGIGMILIVNPKNVGEVKRRTEKYSPVEMGNIVAK
jgi:phosphoribosylformylglycinamidine cyclo-ligase